MTEEAVTWRVLAVDDDPQKLDELDRILSSRMGDNCFDFTKTTSFKEGISFINDNRFDLVFLDVHEDAGDPDPEAQLRQEDQQGEELLHHLQSKRFLPVIFYTGYPTKVAHLQSMVVKVVEKGSSPSEIRTVVNQILDTKLPHLLRYVEEQSRSYIWEALSDLISEHSDEINAADISLLLARKLAASLSQHVVKAMLEMDGGKINPLEMYQYPPSSESCNPADIYRRKNDNSFWMVFTPACDFEQNKADNVLLAKVVPLVEHPAYTEWQIKALAFVGIQEEGDKKKSAKREMNDAKGNVKSLVKGRLGERYRFLPGTFFLPDCVVDFQELVNFPRESAGDFEVVCSLDNPYREEMLHFFSKYYGRIGTPDYDTEPVWEKIEQGFDPT